MSKDKYNTMKMFDVRDNNRKGICSDCKRCNEMQFYHEWRNSCMIWQDIEKKELN